MTDRRVAWGALALVLGIALAACGEKSPTTPMPVPDTCAFAVTPSTITVAAGGQAVTIHIDTAAACPWTARSDSGWIALSATSGTGPADITVTVAANAQPAERTATAIVAGKDVAVRQGGREATPCTYALTSPSSTFGADGGRGRLALETAGGCTWTAHVSATWISLVTMSGTGPGEIVFDVARFDGADQRRADIGVESASFTVRQDPPVAAPCQYSVDPIGVDLHWHGTPGDALDVRVVTGNRCAWTVATGASWMQLLTAGSGTGPATIRVRVGSYTAEPTRSAPLMIRWPSETAGQNVWFAQEGCRYALGPSAQAVDAAGGVFHASVFGDPVSTGCAIGCPWELKTNVSWIHLSGNGTGAGDDRVPYTVDANTTGAPRAGTITLPGWTLTVTQGS